MPPQQMTLKTRIKKAVVEALGGSLLGDRNVTDGDSELVGFRPITGGGRAKTRDLTIMSHKDMINIALYLYSSNALGEWLIDMPVSLTVGQEIGYNVAINAEQADMTPDDAKALTAQIRERLDKFWYHPAHNIAEKAAEYARTYLVTGHLVLPITAVNSVDGIPQFDLIDAAQILDVTGLNGSAIVPAVVLFTPSSDGLKTWALAVLQQDTEGLMVPEDPKNLQTPAPELGIPPDAVFRGHALYFRYNKLLNSRRGVSYLMAVSDWVDALDQFTWASLDRAKLRNNVVWHLKIGAAAAGLNLADEMKKLAGDLTNPGSVYGSKEGIDIEAVSANLGAADTVDLGRMILTHILGSKSMPESWYSSGSSTNKSTAGEQTDVAYKALIALQSRFRAIFRTMLLVAYDSAASKQGGQHGLPKRSEAPWLSIEPNMPVIQERDLARLAASCAQIVAALGGAIDDRLISTKTSRKTFLDVLGQISGGAYELDVEEAQIESEADEREEQADAELEKARARLQASLDDDGSEKDDAEKLQGSKKPAAKTEE